MAGGRGKKRKHRNKLAKSSKTSSPHSSALLMLPSLPVSILDIVNVTASDAGIYTCAPSNARNHSVVVHVVKGNV
jgi:hypothetical protein